MGSDEVSSRYKSHYANLSLNHFCFPDRVKVNGQDMRDCSHEDAAIALKGAGLVVTLIVEYREEEFAEFQKRLPKLQESLTISTEPAMSPENKLPPVKQLYVR